MAKKNSSYTLVQVLVSVAILSVLTTISYYAVSPSRQFANSNNVRRLADVKAIRDGIIKYSQEIQGGSLSFLEAAGVLSCDSVPYKQIGTGSGNINLLAINNGELVSLGYLTKIPSDPKYAQIISGNIVASGYSICTIYQNDVLVKAINTESTTTIVNNIEGIINATITNTPQPTAATNLTLTKTPTPSRTGTPTSTPTPTLDPSNIAFYKFEELGGSTIVSAAYPGTSNLAIITPASPYPSTHSWVVGRASSGYALKLSPVDNLPLQNTLIELASPTLHGITGSMTIMAWVKPANYNIPYTIVDASGPGESANTNRNFELKLTTAPTLVFSWEYGNGSDFTTLPPQTLPQAGTWYHVAVTRDLSGANGIVVFYINGVGYTTSGGTVGNYPSNNNNASMKFSIGKASDTSNEFFNGQIDSIRIFNRVLNSAEVNYYMNVN